MSKDTQSRDKIAAVTFDMDELDVLAEALEITIPLKAVIYEKAVPRMLEMLDEAGIPATFFVITKDLKSRSAQAAVKTLCAKGHEVANHSHNHAHLLDMDAGATRRDTEESTRRLEQITGRKPRGYRGPSLTLNAHLMDILLDLGYEYDSTVNPTLFFITEWLYHFARKPMARNRPRLFYVYHGFAPTEPYILTPPSFFRRGSGKMVELPISRTPYLHIPFYATFHFMFPFTYAPLRALYFSNQNIVYHAHALDFLDAEKDGVPDALRGHVGLRMEWKEKSRYFKAVFSELKERGFKVMTAEDMARKARQSIGA
jgi:peptidoglycan/xylan/chitin deacetylase (PgdA/CDA1 family)